MYIKILPAANYIKLLVLEIKKNPNCSFQPQIEITSSSTKIQRSSRRNEFYLLELNNYAKLNTSLSKRITETYTSDYT
jgi:hypothetical protein